jgi:hypothetical protein
VPTALSAKTATAVRVTSSLLTFAGRIRLFDEITASLIPSYTLLLAVNVPSMASALAVIPAVVIGCIKVYLPASGPPRVNPVVETVFPEPIFLSPNVPAADTGINVTLSPAKTPERVAFPVFNIAAVAPSYILSLAITL